ncbi:MAG TPA: hypothetical protein VGQ83_29430 [Polyangia bacterium]|jgi:hypothetical protein
MSPAEGAALAGVLAAVSAGLATLFGLSARHGFRATERCRALRVTPEPRRPPGHCDAIFDRHACGPGYACFEHRCQPLAPPDPR